MRLPVELKMRFIPGLLILIVLTALPACGAFSAPTPTLTPTPVPSSTPTLPPSETPIPSVTPIPEATEELLPTLEIPAHVGEGVEPPFRVTLPDNWQHGYDTLTLPDVDAVLRAIPLVVYQGPVTGGTGTIVVLWGFPNIIASSPLILPGTPTPAPDLWSDGLRLFRTTMVDQGCNAGTDLERPYSVGGRTGRGTKFAIVDCPDTPDTRGWFVGVQEGGLNFVFYVYTEPIEAMDTADTELQAILDSVEFHVDETQAND
ncbi:MAG: hypothetical protein K8J31_03385 [Anaerolineae bacterium]|nr:hypothetical protein [Anaerolineae bacterium]